MATSTSDKPLTGSSPLVQFLKNLVKYLPHFVLLRLYRPWHRAIHERRLKQALEFTGIPPLDSLDLQSVKKSDTVFLLGSGPSINAIPPERWKVIARHDSIGLNYWTIHRFVPDIYIFESLHQSAAQYPTYREAMAQRVRDYRDTVKIVTDVRPFAWGYQLIYDIPPGFERNLYAAATEPFIGRTETEFTRGLRFLRGKGMFQSSRKVHWLFKYAGSITGLISLAVRMDYRRIVLCGIDLGEQHYFWNDTERYPEHMRWEIQPRHELHFTTRRLPYMVPAQPALWAMKREILDPAGVEIFVESRSSTLYPAIPEAPESCWELRDKAMA